MRRSEIINRIVDEKIIAVVRAENRETGAKIVSSIRDGGIKTIEITMTMPYATDIIKEFTKMYEDILIGAGTVLDPETARMCILSGAKFIVSPCVCPNTIKLCNRYTIPIIPGVMTPKEAIEALELGVELIKIFPANIFGPSIISAFKGPIPQGNFIPTGGVNLENIGDWFKAGAVAVGVGSELTYGAKTGNYSLITETVEKFLNEVKKIKK